MKLPTALLAIAIEDTVDLWFLPDSRKYEQRIIISQEIPEPAATEEGPDKHYLSCVYSMLSGMLAALQQKIRTQFKIDVEIGDLFNSIGSAVVSIPGVIHANRELLQIPLWNSSLPHDANSMTWSPKAGDPTRNSFDFPKELANIAESLILGVGKTWRITERARFEDAVFVVNDTTACAAFEHWKRELEKNRHGDHDFVFVKMHNGINVGVVEKNSAGDLVLRATHAEAGHGFPLLHPLDGDANFAGSCRFHGRCFEGLLASHSFHDRAVAAENPVFKAWQAFLKKTKLTGQARDNALLNHILGDENTKPSGKGEGVALVAWYTAQLIHQMAIGPLGPSQIVIGGKLANRHVVRGIQKHIRDWSQSYPMRSTLGEAVSSFIVIGQANEKNDAQSEVQGALTIAYAKNHLKPPREIKLMDFRPKA